MKNVRQVSISIPLGLNKMTKEEILLKKIKTREIVRELWEKESKIYLNSEMTKEGEWDDLKYPIPLER